MYCMIWLTVISVKAHTAMDALEKRAHGKKWDRDALTHGQYLLECCRVLFSPIPNDHIFSEDAVQTLLELLLEYSNNNRNEDITALLKDAIDEVNAALGESSGTTEKAMEALSLLARLSTTRSAYPR